MKIRRLLSWLGVGCVLFLAVCCLTTRVSAQEGNEPSGITIVRYPEGTSLLIDIENEFSYWLPSGWYPVGLPVSNDEVDQLNLIIDERQLPVDKELIPSIPADAVRFFIFDLDPAHYSDGSQIVIAGPYASISTLIPCEALEPFLEMVKLSEYVVSAETVMISDQMVGIVEFSGKSGDDPFYGGKMILFIRNGKIFGIVGVATEALVPGATSAIDQILGSLAFFESG